MSAHQSTCPDLTDKLDELDLSLYFIKGAFNALDLLFDDLVVGASPTVASAYNLIFTAAKGHLADAIKHSPDAYHLARKGEAQSGSLKRKAQLNEAQMLRLMNVISGLPKGPKRARFFNLLINSNAPQVIADLRARRDEA